jgi:ABC-type branched-subunit amino acid transport system substrate-binding protein
MKKRLFLGAFSILVLLIVTFVGCSTATPSAPATGAPQTSATTAATTGSFKLGLLVNLATQRGLDIKKTIEIAAEKDNKNGGITAGTTKYKIELVEYDSGLTQDTEVTACNKMVFDDKVNFIIEGGGTGGAALPAITEPNNVLLFTPSMTMPNWSPNWKLVFDGAGTSASNAVIVGWLCKNFPDAAKTMMLAYSDDPPGNQLVKMVTGVAAGFGIKPSTISWPASAQDLSSLATKVAIANPGLFDAISIDPIKFGLVFSSVRDSGYKGLLFTTSTQPTSTLVQVMNKNASEGFYGAAYPTEFTPALDQTAQSFMDDWIAATGSWNNPALTYIPSYYCLRTAIQKAGSADTIKVADVLSKGMEYNTPLGPSKMIDRPDLGISRTVNSVYTTYMKTVKDGKPSLNATIKPDEGMGYLQTSLKK